MNQNFVSGLVLAVVGAIASLLAYRLGLGSFREPGSGLIPFGTAVLLTFMCIGLAVKGLLKDRAANREQWAVFKGIRWRLLVFVVCALLAYGMAIDSLGFSVCNFLFFVLLFGTVGRKRYWVTLSASALLALGIKLVFVTWLGSEFPRGFLGI